MDSLSPLVSFFHSLVYLFPSHFASIQFLEHSWKHPFAQVAKSQMLRQDCTIYFYPWLINFIDSSSQRRILLLHRSIYSMYQNARRNIHNNCVFLQFVLQVLTPTHNPPPSDILGFLSTATAQTLTSSGDLKESETTSLPCPDLASQLSATDQVPLPTAATKAGNGDSL